jgi:hypothetical protein
MFKRIKMQGGDEYDAFSKRARGYFNWKRGRLKKIKRGYAKRFRLACKYDIRAKINEWAGLEKWK